VTRTTIADVARAAGVSKGAVSFALNNRPGVAPETRDRILRVARELGWTPSSKARALSVSKALSVGLVMARPADTLRADAFFPAFIAGIESALASRGYSLLLHVVTDAAQAEAVYRRLSGEGRVDGVFVTDLHLDDTRPAVLAELGLPAVIIGPHLGEAFWPAVGIDDAPGIAACVDHLVALGHTRIAHVGGLGTTVHGRSRMEAWRAALERAGLEPGPLVEGDWSAQSAVAATRELLELADRPTAIVYAGDLMAMAGLSLAASLGVRVPEDLSITGFDDIEISAHLQPPLTTVAVDVTAWGRAAAVRLLALIEGDPAMPEELPEELPEARLVVRASTGRVPRRHQT
jgi:LacI family transcriptional regulator, repressor for deo operon, udp, cdd, tsx, nupC, and nupG